MRAFKLSGWIIGGAVFLSAQEVWDTTWTRTYGGSSYDYLLDVTTLGGPFYLVGYTGSFGAGNSDLWLLKVSPSDGATYWERTYGGPDWDYGWSVALSDALVVAGFTRSFAVGWTDLWVLKLDPSTGDTIWTRTYGGFALDRAYDVYASPEGYFVVGCTMSFGAGQYDFWFLKLDPQTGDTLWSRTYGGFANDCGYGVTFYDGHLYLVGYTASFGQGDKDLWLLKVNPQTGDTLWTRTYGGWGEDFGQDIVGILSPQSTGLYATGWTQSFGTGGTDLWILRLDPETGDTLWARTYGGPGDDRGRSISGASGESGLVVGETESFGTGGADAWLLMFDPETGDTFWSRTYGGPAEDRAWASAAGGWGGPFAVAGETRSRGQGDVDGWLLALAPSFGINESFPPSNQISITLSLGSGYLYVRSATAYPFPAVLSIYRPDGRRILRCPIDLRPGSLTLPLSVPSGIYQAELRTRNRLLWNGPLFLLR